MLVKNLVFFISSSYMEVDPLIALLLKLKDSRPALRLLKAGINSSRKRTENSVGSIDGNVCRLCH